MLQNQSLEAMGLLERSKDLSNHVLAQVIATLARFDSQAIDWFNGLYWKFQLLKVVVIADPNVGDLRNDIELFVGVMNLVDWFYEPEIVSGKVLLVEDLVVEFVWVPKLREFLKVPQDLGWDVIDKAGGQFYFVI